MESEAGKALFWKLSNDLAVHSQVEDRIIPGKVPHNDRPYIGYAFGADEEQETLGGPDGLHKTIVTIAVVADDISAARLVAGYINDAINGERGDWNGVNVQGCFSEANSYDEYPEVLEDANEEMTVHICERKFLLVYNV